MHRANVAVKVIDRRTARPIPGASILLGTATYSLRGVTDPRGSVEFVVDVGGGEVGRHPEPGVAVNLLIQKPGYTRKHDRFMLYGNKSVIFQMERM